MSSVERRTRQRFPLNLALKFTATRGRRIRLQGFGDVINISSNGVAFRTETKLSPGMNVRASMAWPVTLNGDCVLRVSVEGRLIREESGLAVVSIERYEFRTGGRVGAPARAEMEALKRGFSAMTTAAPENGVAV